MTVSNMPKAGRIAASRAMRSVRRPLLASPPNATPLQLPMMGIGDDKAEAPTNSSCQILTPAPNSKETPRFVRVRRGRAFSLLLVGTNNLQPAALAGVDHETKAVQPYDRGHQIQAKAHPRRTPDLVGAVETPQHSLALLRTDAGAGIGHTHDSFAIAAQQFDI